MPKRNFSVSVPEAVCANSAMLRSILVHLLRVGVISPVDLEALFMLTKEELACGRYEPSTVAGAQAYLDNLYHSVGSDCIQPESSVKH